MKKYLLFLAILGTITSCASKYIVTDSGLRYYIIVEGKGIGAKAGDEILLFETTAYRNGTILYSNEGKTPVKVKIGANQATQAVDEGLRGMKVGEIRKLIAKPGLVKRTGYPPNVSPDSTLVITMRLFRIIGN